MTSHSIIGRPAFLTGGKAFFTVSNNQGEHFTFKITKGKAPRAPYFASVLKGPDNYANYAYIGMYRSAPTLSVITSEKSRFKEGSKEYKVLLWAVNVIWGLIPCPEGYQIQHAGKCCVCGRKLTTPESIEAGIGATCAANQ